MFRLMVNIFILSFFPFAKAIAIDLETYDNQAGFRVLESGQSNGAGTPLDKSTNFDPQYPAWGSDCNAAWGTSLCWPNGPTNRFSVPAGSQKIRLVLGTDNGYGTGNAMVDLPDGTTLASDLHTFSSVVSREYRLLLSSPVVVLENNCTRFQLVSALPGDLGAAQVYLLSLQKRAQSCNIVLDVSAWPHTGGDISVRFSSVNLRYDNNIYKKLSSGNWKVYSYWADKLSAEALDDKDTLLHSEMLFDRLAMRFNLSLEGYLRYMFLSQANQTLSYDPELENVKAFVFNGRVETNSSNFNFTVQCQYKTGAYCALKNNEGLLLPLKIAYRRDYLGGPNDNGEIVEGVPYKMDSEGNRAFLMGVIFRMYQAEVLSLLRNNSVKSRTFEGSATLIFEATF